MVEKEQQLKKASSFTSASPGEQTTGTDVTLNIKAKGGATLSEFMLRADQPVTWVEIRVIYNGKLPRFQDTVDRFRFGKPYKEQGSELAEDHTSYHPNR